MTYTSHKKLNFAINIPSELRLDFLLKNKGDMIIYHLFALVIHVGNGIDYGHYFCLIKTCGKWFKFDDENVEVYKNKKVDDKKQRYKRIFWKSR